MNQITKRILYWTPRILTLLFAAFVSMFALDVFGEQHGFWQTLQALAIHLIPTYLLLLVLVVTWRWEWVGAVVFPTLGAWYVSWAWTRFPWMTSAIMAGPLFLVGALFLLNWIYRSTLRAPKTARPS